jgi:hypothetical protein
MVRNCKMAIQPGAAAVPKPPFKPYGEIEPTPEPPEGPEPNGAVPKGLARQTIRHLIDGRWLAVYENPTLLTDRTHRWDQSDIFYPMRTMLYRKGYDVSSLSEEEVRGKLYSYIKEYCEKLGIKRHEIGIFAADRAVVAYGGQLYSISFENYKQLAQLGCDVVCIEKESTVEKWATFTEEVGIALVQSQGFVSEYGVMLTQEAKKTGANVMVVTDFDSDGLKIAFHVEGITRIGIDFTTIDEINMQLKAEFEAEDKDEDFEPEPEAPEVDDKDESVYKPDLLDLDPPKGELEKLDIEELVEGRDPDDNWKSLEYLTKGLKRKSISNHKLVPIENTAREREYIKYLKQTHDGQETYLEFLKEKRIELNSIMTEIGAKRFWNWLYNKIVQTYPTRNYTRVIPVPPYEITFPVLDRLKMVVDKQIEERIKDERVVIIDELRQVRGLLNVDIKKDEIDERLNDIINYDKDITKFVENLDKLIKNSFNI